MTGSLRSTARNPVAIALMGLLMLVFLLLGVSGGGRFADIFRQGAGDAVVSAGAHSLNSHDYRRIFDSEVQRLEQQSQQPVTAEVLVQNGFDQQLLNAIAEDEAEAEMLSRAGIDPAPVLVDAEIRKMPVAFDRVTGKFSEAQFVQALQAQGLTVSQVEAELADEVASRHFGYALEAGLRAPLTFAAVAGVEGLENRDVTYFVLDPKTVPAPPAPTDAQLMAFMKAHAADLTRPELRTFTLVRFSSAALAPAITIDPAAVEKAFAAKKDSLSKPETRTLVEIPVRSVAQGQAAAAALAKGAAPNSVAASMGAEPVIWTDKAQPDITDRRIATVAFSMTPGEVRGPVQGDVGLAALKLVKVTPGGVATLENSRAKIEADLRAEAAKNKAYELSQKFDDARQAGSSVADAAGKAGVTAISVGPLTAQGIGLDGKPSPLVNDKILKRAFGAGPGEDTDLEDAGPGDYFALHLDKITPPALPPLAQFRPQLAKAWTTEQFVTALKAKADGLMAQLRKGASMEAVSSSVGAHVVHQVGMQRVSAEQYKAMGRDFLVGVFTAKAGDVFAAPAPNGVFVARLDAVRPGDLTAMARAAQMIAPRVSQAFSQNLLDSVRAASQRAIKTTINLAMARQAIGVDTSTLPKPKTVGRPGGKAK